MLLIKLYKWKVRLCFVHLHGAGKPVQNKAKSNGGCLSHMYRLEIAAGISASIKERQEHVMDIPLPIQLDEFQRTFSSEDIPMVSIKRNFDPAIIP